MSIRTSAVCLWARSHTTYYMENRIGLPLHVFSFRVNKRLVRTKKCICLQQRALLVLALCLLQDIKLWSVFHFICHAVKESNWPFFLVVCGRAFMSQCKSYAAHCMKLCLRHVTFSSIQCHYFLSSSMFTMIFVYMYPAWLRCVTCLGGRWNIIGLAFI